MPKIKKNFIVQKLDGKITIFDSETSYLYSLNETASFIFLKLKAGWDANRIVDKVVNRYLIKPDVASRDVEELLKIIKKKNIFF